MPIYLPDGTSKKELNSDFFLRYLYLDESTGMLYWHARTVNCFPNEHQMKVWNSRHANRRAGTVHRPRSGSKRIQITLAKNTFKAHRIVALLAGKIACYGDERQIDHINGNSCDNRPENLRAISHQINLRNQTNRISSAKVTGVYWHGQSGKWQVQIGRGPGKSRSIGYFDDWFDAVCARKSNEVKLGYTSNHCKM